MAFFPRRTPPAFSLLLQALGNPPVHEVARFLGVTPRTIYAWRRADRAPRAALLALFWESHYGFSALDSDREYRAQVLQSLTDALRNENAMLRARIARLESIGQFGAANAPFIAAR